MVPFFMQWHIKVPFWLCRQIKEVNTLKEGTLNIITVVLEAQGKDVGDTIISYFIICNFC